MGLGITVIDRLEQPDLWVRTMEDPLFTGDGLYSLCTAQMKSTLMRAGTTTPVYNYVRIQNDGTCPDSFVLRDTGVSAGWSVRYYRQPDRTLFPMSMLGWTVGPIAPGASHEIYLRVSPASTLKRGSKAVTLTARSVGDAIHTDTVQLTTTLPSPKTPDFWLHVTGLSGWLGKNIINTTGVGQAGGKTVGTDETAYYYLRVVNCNEAADQITFDLPHTAHSGWSIRCYTLNNVAYPGTTWSVLMSPDGQADLMIKVTPNHTVASGATCPISLMAMSTADAAKRDIIRITTTKF